LFLAEHIKVIEEKELDRIEEDQEDSSDNEEPDFPTAAETSASPGAEGGSIQAAAQQLALDVKEAGQHAVSRLSALPGRFHALTRSLRATMHMSNVSSPLHRTHGVSFEADEKTLAEGGQAAGGDQREKFRRLTSSSSLIVATE
jgi:hypothetical protein